MVHFLKAVLPDTPNLREIMLTLCFSFIWFAQLYFYAYLYNYLISSYRALSAGTKPLWLTTPWLSTCLAQRLTEIGAK